MDKLLLKSKFENNSDVEISNFYNELNSINHNSETEDYIICVIDVFGVQLVKYNPEYRSKDYYLITKCVNEIIDLIRKNITDKIVEKFIDMIKITIQSGWTKTNCDLINTMGLCFTKDYFENLSNVKLLNHLSIFDEMDLAIPKQEITDNFSSIREGQKKFVLQMFLNQFSTSTAEKFPEVFMTFRKKLYLRSWNENESETEIYSTLSYRMKTKFKNVFSSNLDHFQSIFAEISDKLIQDNISTKAGRDMMKEFYSSSGDVYKRNQECIELMTEKMAKVLFDLYKLKRHWMNIILRDVAYQIKWIDKKFRATAFKNCEYLINDAIEYLLTLLDNYPQLSEDEKRGTTSNKVSEWCDMVKAMTESFLQFTLQTSTTLELLIPCLQKLILLNNNEASEIFKNCFSNIEKQMIDVFKNKPDILIPLIDQCVNSAMEASKSENINIPFPFGLRIFDYDDYYERITKFGKFSKAIYSASVQECIRLNLLKILNDFSVTITIFLSRFQEFIIFKDYSSDQIFQFIQLFNIVIDKELFLIYNPKAFAMGSIMKNCVEHISQYQTKYSNSFPELVITCKLCLKNGLVWESNPGETSFNANSMIILFILQQLLVTKPVPACTEELYSLLFKVIDETDESHSYYSSWISFVSVVPRLCATPEILISNVPNIIILMKNINETKYQNNINILLDSLSVMISSKPSAALDYVEDLENLIFMVMSGTNVIPILQILTIIYEEYPEKINDIFLEKFCEQLSEDSTNAFFLANLYKTISKTHPHMLKSLFSKIIESLNIHKLIVASPTIETLTNILANDPSFGEQIFFVFENFIDKNNNNNTFCMTLLNGFRQIGLLRHDLLVKLEEKIKVWQQMSASFYDICQHLLDVIADRSLAQLDSNINQQGKEIQRIDNVLENQKDKVETINEEIKQQKENIEEINKRVDDSEHQIEELRLDVEEINDQVQEIDQKTISNAPKWAREVSKLLNPPSDDDWKLLGLRLGYNSDDIRAWSTHADPCMSLLSDWFAVRRHVEATRAILEQLNEINRSDVAKIVEDALTVAESMVSDDDPIEFVTPPLIFLSYQWSNQEEVKMLREHLQKAGYRCWMDIGQMGGGDKLYEAIDRGIRGAKVFICCVTKKYSESANCKRELNLAINLQKSVIPLQMERIEWPPIGTMGPLLTEYIFIRMFGKPGTEPVSGTFWPKDRFHELLMQIRYSCAPDYDLIDESYSNWWQPPEIKPNHQNKENKIISENISKPLEDENKNNNTETPEIFISYQWGKQEEIKKLKSVLTKSGYHCWMDIFQMGGGDSLYDKIDKGLRGCRLMISCVTPKYAESPNCRREVSLCDSLKKPIIPIMLERIIWPPAGPMSMVLNPLSYISFVDTYEEQQSWNGQATNELLDRISKIILGKRRTEMNNEVLIMTTEKQSQAKMDKSIRKEISNMKISVNNNMVKMESGRDSSSSMKPNLPIFYSTTCIIS